MTDPRRVARLLVLTASNRLIHGADGPDGWKNTGEGGTTFGGDEFATPIEDVARNLDDIGAQRMTQSRTRYDLLVELCAGTAALSWASAGMRFPVSRMGSKAGYAHAILSSVGLREGDPLPRYLWNEPDPELARTLALLASPGGAQAVAEVIRSWIPCPNGHEADGGSWCLDCATWTNGEPLEDVEHVERKRDGTIRRWASGPSTGKQDARRLWERLRKERPEASPAREGAWCFVAGGSKFDGESIYGGNLLGQDDGPRGSRDNKKPLTERLPRDCDALAPLPASVVCGRAEDIEPRGVARFLELQRSSNSSLPIVWTGERFDNTKRRGYAGKEEGKATVSAESMARGLERRQPLPADVLCARAEDVSPEMAARLLHVRPESPALDGVDGGLLDAVPGSVDAPVLRPRADVAHGVGVEDGAGVLDADLCSPVGDLVPDVLLLRTPPEVVCGVVGPGAVEVPDNMPGRARPVEGRAHKAGDAPVDTHPASAEDESAVSALAHAADQGPTGVDGPDLAGGRDLVFGGLGDGSPFGMHGGSIPDMSRVLIYIDPPYSGTTGYAHLFPRGAVVAVARRWAEAGAHVVISEAEPIPELVADGWTFSDIADARIGQRRTFSRQQREVLTSNRPLVPRHAWPSRESDPRQGGLFAQGSAL